METTVPSMAVRLFGTEQVDPPLRRLRAGPLSIAFDNGAVRYVHFGDVEVLRGIAFLVRDENWGTLTPVIEDLDINEPTDGFTINYRASCSDASRRLDYRARIAGGLDGSLSFAVEAEPQTDILTNRTGFVVLHPIRDLAGEPLKIRHADGSEATSNFPSMIDPRVPFTAIRTLSHEIAPGVWATCSMEGTDAYEMEDQRNWSDASYKTYVRSLRQPWPYLLPKDEKFTQAVHLTMRGGQAPKASLGGTDPVVAVSRRAVGSVPEIGVGVPAEEAEHALSMPELTMQLAPRWLICQVDLRLGHGPAELDRYARLAESVGASVVLEIITKGTLDPLGELGPIADAARTAGLVAEALTVFPAQDMVSVQPDAPWPSMPSFADNYAAARRAFPGVRLGGGMAAYFTELNRKRPPTELIDYLTFTTCPNVHAADDVSVMETLEAIPHQIRSARAFAGKEVVLRIGPSQLGCRENPYGRATSPNPGNRRVCLSRIDPRQRGLFNAAWTLGYVAAVAREGVAAVALGAPTGEFGHFYRRSDFQQSWYDEQDGALVFPSYHVMAGLSQLSGAELLKVDLPRGIDAVAARKGGHTIIWLANLTGQVIQIRLDGLPAVKRMSMLSAETFERAARDTRFIESHAAAMLSDQVKMEAYSLARIETTE